LTDVKRAGKVFLEIGKERFGDMAELDSERRQQAILRECGWIGQSCSLEVGMSCLTDLIMDG